MKMKILEFSLVAIGLLPLALVGCNAQNRLTSASKPQAPAVASKQQSTPDNKMTKNPVIYSGDAPISPDQSPEFMINSVYQGVRIIHQDRGTPQLKWGMQSAIASGCGTIDGSAYCPLDHTIYIPMQDIQMAYQHGDAALAYIIGHEYAHAMQRAFGFKPEVTPISELQADCLSGLYLGTMPNVTFDRRDIEEIRSIAYRLGDYNLAHPDHHGTPAQRLQAVEAGIRGAIDSQGFAACQVQ